MGNVVGLNLSTRIVLDTGLVSAEGMDDLKAGDIDIHKTESGDGSTERRLVPKILEFRCK